MSVITHGFVQGIGVGVLLMALHVPGWSLEWWTAMIVMNFLLAWSRL